MKARVVTSALSVFLVSATVFASGVLIPKDPGVPPLAIKHQRVDIRIKDGVATATMEQVFKNSTDRDLEAVYVFPLPEDASVTDFAMYINGKRTRGELVEKEKARSIYQDIVRRMKDPGLLEYIGGNLFRVSVYPVPRNSDQKIELTYSQPLAFESGLYKFVYPLKTDDRSATTLEDFTVRVSLSSSLPIRSVYSPSHTVGVDRKGEHSATVGFEESKSILNRDFVLYYGVDKKDFGINLLTHCKKGGDGFFLMMIAPGVKVEKDEVIKRDVIFVFDTSGSMAGEKIKQTQGALKYCVNKLNKGDRFNIVRFSTDVDCFNPELLEATDANKKKAVEYVDKIEARGGTDINSAMLLALAQKRDEERPLVLVFLTDGQPTIGTTDNASILDNVKKAIGKRTRLFVFGVGENVNTHLLDRLAGDNGGIPQYVGPQEDIEVKVSAFYDKISLPVLSQPKVTVDKIKVREVHPQTLPDLFAGGQLIVAGRYEGKGDSAIRLTGEINGKPAEFVFEGAFPAENSENDFIPQIWATRRVGYLLDQIRLKGENAELREEVIRLGKEYGIMTPYTAYLVLEDDKSGQSGGGLSAPAEAPARREAESGHLWTRASRSRSEEKASVTAVPVFGESVPMANGAGAGARALSQPAVMNAKKADLDRYFDKQEGLQAIELGEAIRRYQSAEAGTDKVAGAVRRVGSRIFYLLNGVWTDRDYRPDMKKTTVKYGSEDYFKLIEEKPELKKCFALGESVIVCTGQDNAIVVERAEETPAGPQN